jgi:hypothetical protein
MLLKLQMILQRLTHLTTRVLRSTSALEQNLRTIAVSSKAGRLRATCAPEDSTSKY